MTQTPHAPLRVDSAEGISEDIRTVRENGVVRIFCGEARTEIYNDARFIETVAQVVRERGALVRVITGPVILIDPRYPHGNGLLRLHRELKALDLLMHRPRRSPAMHFRLVETVDGYTFSPERPHDPLPPRTVGHGYPLEGFSDEERLSAAEGARGVFDSWADRLREMARKLGQPMAPLALTDVQLKLVLERAEHAGRSFDYLGRDEIERLLDP